MPLDRLYRAVQAGEGPPAADQSFQEGVGQEEGGAWGQGGSEVGSDWWVQGPAGRRQGAHVEGAVPGAGYWRQS